MAEIDDKFELGTWIRNEDVSAYTNVYMRTWRAKHDGKVITGVAPFTTPGIFARDIEWYSPPPEPRETLKEAAMRLTTIPRVARKKNC